MDPDQLARLIRGRATRQFAAGPAITHETVVELVDAARWTGSARNRQPWRFVEVRDRAVLGALAALGGYAQFIADAPLALVIAAADNGFADTAYDAGRVTQSLILAAGVRGIASCPATIFPAAHVDAAAELLRLPPGWHPDHVLALGYPAPTAATGARVIPSGRLAVDELLTVR